MASATHQTIDAATGPRDNADIKLFAVYSNNRTEALFADGSCIVLQPNGNAATYFHPGTVESSIQNSRKAGGADDGRCDSGKNLQGEETKVHQPRSRSTDTGTIAADVHAIEKENSRFSSPSTALAAGSLERDKKAAVEPQSCFLGDPKSSSFGEPELRRELRFTPTTQPATSSCLDDAESFNAVQTGEFCPKRFLTSYCCADLTQTKTAKALAFRNTFCSRPFLLLNDDTAELAAAVAIAPDFARTSAGNHKRRHHCTPPVLTAYVRQTSAKWPTGSISWVEGLCQEVSRQEGFGSSSKPQRDRFKESSFVQGAQQVQDSTERRCHRSSEGVDCLITVSSPRLRGTVLSKRTSQHIVWEDWLYINAGKLEVLIRDVTDLDLTTRRAHCLLGQQAVNVWHERMRPFLGRREWTSGGSEQCGETRPSKEDEDALPRASLLLHSGGRLFSLAWACLAPGRRGLRTETGAMTNQHVQSPRNESAENKCVRRSAGGTLSVSLKYEYAVFCQTFSVSGRISTSWLPPLDYCMRIFICLLALRIEDAAPQNGKFPQILGEGTSDDESLKRKREPFASSANLPQRTPEAHRAGLDVKSPSSPCMRRGHRSASQGFHQPSYGDVQKCDFSVCDNSSLLRKEIYKSDPKGDGVVGEDSVPLSMKSRSPFRDQSLNLKQAQLQNLVYARMLSRNIGDRLDRCSFLLCHSSTITAQLPAPCNPHEAPQWEFDSTSPAKFWGGLLKEACDNRLEDNSLLRLFQKGNFDNNAVRQSVDKGAMRVRGAEPCVLWVCGALICIDPPDFAAQQRGAGAFLVEHFRWLSRQEYDLPSSAGIAASNAGSRPINGCCVKALNNTHSDRLSLGVSPLRGEEGNARGSPGVWLSFRNGTIWRRMTEDGTVDRTLLKGFFPVGSDEAALRTVLSVASHVVGEISPRYARLNHTRYRLLAALCRLLPGDHHDLGRSVDHDLGNLPISSPSSDSAIRVKAKDAEDQIQLLLQQLTAQLPLKPDDNLQAAPGRPIIFDSSILEEVVPVSAVGRFVLSRFTLPHNFKRLVLRCLVNQDQLKTLSLRSLLPSIFSGTQLAAEGSQQEVEFLDSLFRQPLHDTLDSCPSEALSPAQRFLPLLPDFYKLDCHFLNSMMVSVHFVALPVVVDERCGGTSPDPIRSNFTARRMTTSPLDHTDDLPSAGQPLHGMSDDGSPRLYSSSSMDRDGISCCLPTQINPFKTSESIELEPHATSTGEKTPFLQQNIEGPFATCTSRIRTSGLTTRDSGFCGTDRQKVSNGAIRIETAVGVNLVQYVNADGSSFEIDRGALGEICRFKQMDHNTEDYFREMHLAFKYIEYWRARRHKIPSQTPQ